MSAYRPPRGEGMALCFLDYDGCLHHENVWVKPKTGPYIAAPGPYRLFQHAAVLEELMAPFPNVRIVLSTSWVVRYGFTATAKNLPRGLRDRCIGATYHSALRVEDWFSIPRGVQITNDVRRRRPGAWFALDDDVEGWPEATRMHLVQTDPVDGIGPPEIQASVQQKLRWICDQVEEGSSSTPR